MSRPLLKNSNVKRELFRNCNVRAHFRNSHAKESVFFRKKRNNEKSTIQYSETVKKKIALFRKGKEKRALFRKGKKKHFSETEKKKEHFSERVKEKLLLFHSLPRVKGLAKGLFEKTLESFRAPGQTSLCPEEKNVKRKFEI